MEEKVKSLKFWDFIPQILITGLVFLLPLFFLPANLVDFSTTKSGLFLGIFLLAIFIWSLNKLKETKIYIPFNLVSLSVFLLFLSYLISGILSTNLNLSFFGRDLSYDSVLVFSSLLLFFVSIINLFQSKKLALRIILAAFSSIFLVLLFHIIRLLFLDFSPTLNFFFSSSTNTVGRWIDFGIFGGIGVIISLLSLEMFNFNKKVKISSILALILSLLTLFIVDSQKIWIIVGLFALMFFVYFFSMNKTSVDQAEEGAVKKVPTSSLITFLIAAVFILGSVFVNPLNSPFGEFRNNLFNVSYLEFSPSFFTTNKILKDVLKEKPLAGSGPAMFDMAWIDYKPVEFYLTDIWNVDFRYGYGLIPTFMVMSGWPGVIAWLLFLGIFLYYGLKSIFKPISDSVSQFILISSFLTSMYLWVTAFVYVPSFVNLIFAFTFTGIFYASLYREGILRNQEIDIVSKPKYSFFFIFSLVLILLALLISGWYFTSRIYASINLLQGNIALEQNDVNLAETKILNSLNLYPTDVAFQKLTDIGLIRLSQVLNSEDNMSDSDKKVAFESILSTTILSVEEAIKFSPGNYNNYLKFGEIYENLLALGNEESYEIAKESYSKARELNPENPEIILRLARLEFEMKKNEEARKLIAEALKLKRNYTEAIFFLSQIDVAEGNIDQAVANVESATTIKPNDPLVYFQLGILRYQNEDFAGATSAFISALNLNPEYDNARYFLGLSFDRTGQKNEAVIQFQILKERNPNNEEVDLILSNLLAGRSAFTGVTEPLDENPENRETLPIEEEPILEE